MQFKVSPSFWEVFPEGEISVLVLKGINNNPGNTDFSKMLEEANGE